ncbi:unnamed protein product [Blepharisma stoltei]|uniref:Uncharacterized protein n=1 Tax=Blepharisma stoltei TaxID=1481888 RepID=A0AAU9I3B8_9CILI|nr:unnamed protein product [Blepharisma stoltei]
MEQVRLNQISLDSAISQLDYEFNILYQINVSDQFTKDDYENAVRQIQSVNTCLESLKPFVEFENGLAKKQNEICSSSLKAIKETANLKAESKRAQFMEH